MRHSTPLGSEKTTRPFFGTPGQLEPLESRVLLDAQPVGPEFRVNTHTSRKIQPAVAMGAAGQFVATWSSSGQDGSSYGVYAQRYDAVGVPQGGEFRVNTYTTSMQVNSCVAMDADGDFVVAWRSDGQDGSGRGVYAQRYNSSGVSQGSEFRVNTFTTGDQGWTRITTAMATDGRFVIVWDSIGQDGDDSGIYAQRYDAAGAPQGNELRVNTYTTDFQRTPSVAMDADGDSVIAWASIYQDGSAGGVYAQRYNSLGEPQGGEFRVNSYTTDGQGTASAATNADGNFVVTWQSQQDGSEWGIYAQRYNAGGVPQAGEFRVNTSTLLSQQRPSIAMDADGDFIVAWDSGGYVPYPPPPDVYAQRYDGAGVPQEGEFRVNTYTTNSQGSPVVAMDQDGDFVIAWASAQGPNQAIYAQRYAMRPEVSASSFPFDTAPHRMHFTFDRDVGASLGTDDIVLENLTTMQTIPSSDLALAYDPLTNTATFTYVGPGASAIPSVLPDGDYRATLVAAGISTPQGGQLASDYVLDFFFLNGDANRDRRVNLDDFNILAANFGQSPRDFTHGDFTYDTIVNLNDFNILAARFGVALSPSGGGTFGSTRIDAMSDDADSSDDALAALLD